MTRARALVAAVPQRVYTAVAGLVLLASLGVALVLGAGLATWQGGVNHDSGRPGARPPSVVSPPRSAVIVVPTPKPPAAHVPDRSAPTVRTVAVQVPAPAVHPEHPITPQPPAVTPPTTPVAQPRVVTTSKHANHGKHLGWTKGARGNGHGHGKGTTRTHG